MELLCQSVDSPDNVRICTSVWQTFLDDWQRTSFFYGWKAACVPVVGVFWWGPPPPTLSPLWCEVRLRSRRRSGSRLTEWLLREGHESGRGGGEERLWRGLWQPVNITDSHTSQHSISSFCQFCFPINPLISPLLSTSKHEWFLSLPSVITIVTFHNSNSCFHSRVFVIIWEPNMTFVMVGNLFRLPVFISPSSLSHLSPLSKMMMMSLWGVQKRACMFPRYPCCFTFSGFRLTWISLTWLSPKLITATG